MTKRIAVFHFSPLEMFPPVMNFLNCLALQLEKDSEAVVYTTSQKKLTFQYHSPDSRITIIRLAEFTYGLGTFDRWKQYFIFYSKSLQDCLRKKPDVVFYYETISSFVPYLIKRWFYKKTDLFIHYHEYMNPSDYRLMLQNRIFHRLEKTLYQKARWISHTNSLRMEKFLHDIGNPRLSNTHIFPNYPPSSWKTSPRTAALSLPLRLVYVGSMGSLELLYIRETFEWIRSKAGSVSLDIYSFYVAKDAEHFIKQLNCASIVLKGPVGYEELPGILPKYDVGLILYKPVADNMIYNSPNKLFEYLTCGLDVWYPKEMIGSREYESQEYWPKVMGLDFSNLHQYTLEDLMNRKKGYQRNIDFSCERESAELIDRLQN